MRISPVIVITEAIECHTDGLEIVGALHAQGFHLGLGQGRQKERHEHTEHNKGQKDFDKRDSTTRLGAEVLRSHCLRSSSNWMNETHRMPSGWQVKKLPRLKVVILVDGRIAFAGNGAIGPTHLD